MKNTTINANKKISTINTRVSSKTLVSKPIINLIKTGRNIKLLRIKNGYSVRELQEIFNFTYPQAIYAWQDGKAVPTIDNLIVLSRLFNVSIEKIIVTDEIVATKQTA